MTRASELAALANLPDALRGVKWKRKRGMMRLAEMAGVFVREVYGCDCEGDCECGGRTYMVPDFFAVVGDEFWLLEVEDTHDVTDSRILQWALIADNVGHLVTVRLFVHAARLKMTAECDLSAALLTWYAASAESGTSATKGAR